MSNGWYVGVAEYRRDGIAQRELIEHGTEVYFPRRWVRAKLAGGGYTVSAELLLPPYFYASFDLAVYPKILRTRGIARFLEIAEGVPGKISEDIIKDGRQRELDEQAGMDGAHKLGRTDLVLGRQYTIYGDQLWRGYTGELIDASRGKALLIIDDKPIRVDDDDIELSGSAAGAIA